MLHKVLSSMGGLEAWTAILERLPKARFLLGQGKSGFWNSIEALCSEHIRVKLLEGAYDQVRARRRLPRNRHRSARFPASPGANA